MVTAVVLGVLITIVFGAANAYLGLRAGLTVSASIPAAVVSMGYTTGSKTTSPIVRTAGS